MADASQDRDDQAFEHLLHQVSEAAVGQRSASEFAAGELDASDLPTSVDDDIQQLLRQAEEALASVDNSAGHELEAFQFQDFSAVAAAEEATHGDPLQGADLDLRIELGRTEMDWDAVQKLRRGAVVALDNLAGDPVDVYVSGRLVARGEVLVMNEKFCVRVSELLADEGNH